MSKILSRCQKALESQMIDMQISLNKHKSMMKKTFGISSTAGAMAALTSLAFASGNATTGGDVAQFGTQIGTALGNIYDTAFKVITAAAALALLIAFGVRMAGNPQKAAQATDWIVRIVVCYIGLNCVGLIFKIIQGATKGMSTGISTIKTGG